MITFCSLYSGSSGNAIYLASPHTKILIDCGVSGKKIAASLACVDVDAKDIDAILVTHEHRDHCHAVGIMSRRYDIPIYANRSTWEQMAGNLGCIKEHNRKCIDTDTMFDIQDIAIKPFSVPHDAAEPVGYNFHVKDTKVTLATDIGHVSPKLITYLEGSKLILLESNHDVEMLKSGAYPYYLKQRILSDKGHLSNEAAGELAAHLADKGTSHFLLGHLSKENNFPELAYQTVFNAFTAKKMKVGKDLLLEVAARESVSKVYQL